MMKHRINNHFSRAASALSWIGVAAGVIALSGCGGTADEADTSVSNGSNVTQTEQADPPVSKETETPTEPVGGSEADSSSAVGTLSGVVTFDGPVPDLPLLLSKGDTKAKDANVCAAHDVPDQSLIVNSAAANGIANVFVYLARAPKGFNSPVPAEPVVMDQEGCVFLPHAMLVRAGQTVLVKSGDSIPHNVHTFPSRNSGENALVSPNDRSGLKLVYRRAEPIPVEVRCDVHSWMRAYHLVLDHPFMAVTDSNGEFTIEGLPAGKHKIRVWHERAEFLERSYEAEIKAGETAEITLSFSADKFANVSRPAPKGVSISSK